MDIEFEKLFLVYIKKKTKFQGVGMVGGRLASFEGLAGSLINRHNFLMLLKEAHYIYFFRGEGVGCLGSLMYIYTQQNQLCLNASTPTSTVLSVTIIISVRGGMGARGGLQPPKLRKRDFLGKRS